MQTSVRVCVLSGVVLAFGCTGFEPRNYDAPALPHASGGGAGYSYQAGHGGAGSAAVLPAADDRDGDWGPSAAGTLATLGEGGTRDEPAPANVREGTAGGTKRGAGTETGGEGGNAGDDAGHGTSGGSSNDGHLGGAGYGGAAGGRGGTASAAGRAGSAGHSGSAGHAAAAGRGGAGTGAGGSGGTDTSPAGHASDGGAAAQSGAPPSVIFSEYVEGSSSYKALEVRALAPGVLDGCRIATYSNGNSGPKPSASVALSGTLTADATLVVCSAALSELLGAVCTLTASLSFNGNDALVLECGEQTLDVIGQVGLDPGEAWTSGDASTANRTLRRRCAVTHGDTERADGFDPALEWVALPTDDFGGLGLPDCG